MIRRLETYLKEKFTKELPGLRAHAQMTNSVREREMMKHGKTPREAGVLLLIYWHKELLHIPMILRPVYNGVHSGQMAFPGGRYEPKDRDLIDTALRETHEEIGVKKERNHVIGTLTELYIPPSNTVVKPVVAIAQDRPKFEADPREVAAIYEFPLNAFWNLNNKKEVNVAIAANFKIKTPSFVIGESVIWGASAMIMNELLHLLEDFSA